MATSEKHMLRKKTESQCLISELLGKPLEVLPSSKLPTKRVALLRFLGKRQQYLLENKTSNTPRKCIAADIVTELTSV